MGLEDCRRIAIVSHDRGGAEVVADIARSLAVETAYVSAGPARGVFDEALPHRTEVLLPEALIWADTVIVTTGWQTDWELSAQAAAQERGLRTAVVLDNWVNFSGRFQHHGYSVTPRELWVVDDLAARSAAEAFPKALVRELPWNHYDKLVDRITAARRDRQPRMDGRMRVLFVGENVAEFEETLGEGADFGFDQFDALAHAALVLHRQLGDGFVLRVRPHPSEDPSTYGPAIAHISGGAELSGGELFDDLTWCDIAIGLSSIALYYADRSGIPTGTSSPIRGTGYHQSPWGFPSVEQLLGES
jgi:hypothetical protein